MCVPIENIFQKRVVDYINLTTICHINVLLNTLTLNLLSLKLYEVKVWCGKCKKHKSTVMAYYKMFSFHFDIV